MLNDIIVAYSGTNPTWETAQVKKVRGADESFGTALNKATKTDTFEFSGAVQKDNAFAAAKTEQAAIASELSGMHSDVNKFIEIKNQVRAGTYELNATEIAKGIANYSIF